MIWAATRRPALGHRYEQNGGSARVLQDGLRHLLWQIPVITKLLNELWQGWFRRQAVRLLVPL